MCNLELPPYIINMSFLRAIRRDIVKYVEGTLRRSPGMASALFYTVDWSGQSLPLFDSFLAPPPRILLLTPLAYALLFDSPRVLAYLLQKDEELAPCYTADCLDPEGVWYQSYRLIEFSPLLVRKPSSRLLTLPSGAELLNSPQRLSCTIYERGSVTTQSVTEVENIWEALWCVWSQFRNTEVLIDTSADLFITGCDARNVVSRVDFEKVAMCCKHSQSEGKQFVHFLQLLILHGADLTTKAVLANFVNAITQLVAQKGCDKNARRGLLMSVYCLAGKPEWGEFDEAFERLRDVLKIRELPQRDRDSLQMMCVRRIRRLIPGEGFFRRIRQLPLLNEDCKRTAMTGLIKHRQASEKEATALKLTEKQLEESENKDYEVVSVTDNTYMHGPGASEDDEEEFEELFFEDEENM